MLGSNSWPGVYMRSRVSAHNFGEPLNSYHQISSLVIPAFMHKPPDQTEGVQHFHILEWFPTFPDEYPIHPTKKYLEWQNNMTMLGFSYFGVKSPPLIIQLEIGWRSHDSSQTNLTKTALYLFSHVRSHVWSTNALFILSLWKNSNAIIKLLSRKRERKIHP